MPSEAPISTQGQAKTSAPPQNWIQHSKMRFFQKDEFFLCNDIDNLKWQEYFPVWLYF